MFDQFISYLQDTRLFAPGDPVLLAVSGGIDSVVMAELFHRAGFRFGIAHCNFQLRNEESDEDESFVNHLAEKFGVPFYCQRFNTSSYAEERRISIQMAARELRYAWYETVMDEYGYTCVATAHHLDDQIETFLINLLRGTGIAGLHGILPRQNRIIRPMLFCYRLEIEQYAQDQGVVWRIDRSNRSTEYLRNQIRLKILPVIESARPGYRDAIHSTISHLKQVEQVFRDYIRQIEMKAVTHLPDKILISISELSRYEYSGTLLFELLSPFGFNYSTVSNIVNSFHGLPGKRFLSATHQLIRDREQLVLVPLETFQDKDNGPFLIDKDVKEVSAPVQLFFRVIENDPSFRLPVHPGTACLDLSQIHFPLVLRKWQKGDLFQPLGMSGSRKLSDFFVDNKLSINQKKDTWLLISAGIIIWVVGHRIDHRFRVTPLTDKILIIEMKS